MQNKHRAIAIIGGVVTLGGLATLYFYLKGKRLPASKNPDSVDKSPASIPKQADAPSVFPLKNGSSGALVTQLQSLLGVVADGKFGPKTLAALTAQTGHVQIDSQQQFNDIITALQSKPIIEAAKSRAAMLISQYNASPNSRMMAIAQILAPKVIMDASSALQATGVSLRMEADTRHDHGDYVPKSSTTAGYLLFQVNSGDYKGLYKVDPTKITIV